MADEKIFYLNRGVTTKWGISEYLLIIIMFSPYVFASIRFDHIIIVLLSFLMLFKKLHKGAFLSVCILLLYYVVILFSTLLGIGDNQLATNSQIADSFEWYLRGAIIFLFVSSQKMVSLSTLHNLIIIYIVSSLIIGLIAILQIIYGDVVNNIIALLYIPGHYGGVTFYSMMTNLRFSSIVYQPVSYGLLLMYSISLVLLYTHYFNQHKITRNVLIFILLPLSILSISKAVFLGVPVLMLFLLLRNKVNLFLLLLSIIVLYFVILAISTNLIWKAYDWGHILSIASNPLYLLNVLNTAIESRFSGYGTVSGDVSIFYNNPIIGVGWLNYYARLGDSGYVPVLVRGGLIGLLLYLAYIFSVFYQVYQATTNNSSLVQFKNLYLFFILTSLVFAVGSPVLYIDRVADFYWLLSGAILSVYRSQKQKEMQLTISSYGYCKV